MALIAILDGMRVTMYPKDHPPPLFHVKIAEYEAIFSVATGELLEGSLPPAKLHSLRAWYVAHQDEISYLSMEVRSRRPVRRIDQ